MTTRAIFEDGQLHIPVQRVLSGELTIRQVDKTYKGAWGLCPDCEGIRGMIDFNDPSSLARAWALVDHRVKYRRGTYQTEEILRQMHFCHCRGYRASDGGVCNALSGVQALHREIQETIALHYRKKYPAPDYIVQVEFQAEAWASHRPDVAVLSAHGKRLICVEYQRSAEAFKHFVERHDQRVSAWETVEWFFDRKIYGERSTRQARDHLAERGDPFFVCWVDRETKVLQVEAGTPGEAGAAPKDPPSNLKTRTCSLASIIQAAEDDGWQRTDSGILLPGPAMPNRAAGIEGLEAARERLTRLYRLAREAEERNRQREAEAEQYRQDMDRIDSLIRELARHLIIEESSASWTNADADDASWASAREEARLEVQRLEQILTAAEERREKEQQERRARDAAIKSQMVAEIEELQQFVANIRPWHQLKPSTLLSVDTLQAELDRLRALKPRAEEAYRRTARQKELWAEIQQLRDSAPVEIPPGPYPGISEVYLVETLERERDRILKYLAQPAQAPAEPEESDEDRQERELTRRWRAVLDYMTLVKAEIPNCSRHDLEQLERLEARVKSHRAEVRAALKARGRTYRVGQSDKESWETLRRLMRDEYLKKADASDSPAEAVMAFITVQQTFDHDPAWLIHKLRTSPHGTSLKAWETLAAHQGRKKGWAWHRLQEAIAERQERGSIA